MTITVTFEVWCAAVAVYLDRLSCPRALSEMPAGLDVALATWYAHGVRAYVVAVCLSGVTWPGKSTLDSDPLVPEQRRRVVIELAERMAA